MTARTLRPRIVAACAALAAGTLFLTACGSDGGSSAADTSAPLYNKLPASIQKAGVVKVGSEVAYAPVEFKQGDKIVGIDPELAEALGKQLGVKFQIQDAGFDTLITSLDTKRIDLIMSAMTDNKERQGKGVDFVDYLSGQLAECDVLLAIIGPKWLDAKDDTGRRRLDDPADYVRLEIAAALDRKIRVVPVLVDGARIPRPDELPEDIKTLARRNAIELRNDKFSRDVDALADSVLGGRTSAWTPRALLKVGGAALIVLLASWIGLHALGVAVPWPGPTRLQALAANELMLVNSQTGECLTIAGGVVFDNNVDAVQGACDGEPVRRWWLEETPVADVYKIKNAATGRCLTIAGGVSPANYVRALQYECDDDPSRTWTITDTASRTNSPPTIASTISCLIATATAPSSPPSASDPVSPMKIDAGGALSQRNPRLAPITAPQSTASSPVPAT